MFWNQLDDEPETDSGLDVLPFQEYIDEQPIQLKIDEERLSVNEVAKLKCFLEANMDLFANHDVNLGDTDLITHKIDVGEVKPVKSRP